jgi:hypothetical protein
VPTMLNNFSVNVVVDGIAQLTLDYVALLVSNCFMGVINLLLLLCLREFIKLILWYSYYRLENW